MLPKKKEYVMMLRLFVDDIRNAPDPSWIVARTYFEAIQCLRYLPIDVLSLDHDLGEYKTGYDVICWLEERVRSDPDYYSPRFICCHSANPVGKKKIEAAIKSIKDYEKKVLDMTRAK